jgi:DNA-binding MarR family transcriptional regulator
VGERALAELEARAMLEPPSRSADDGARRPNAAGEEAFARLIAERRASLATLLDGWSPDEHPEVASLLTRLARELAAEPPAHVGAAA